MGTVSGGEGGVARVKGGGWALRRMATLGAPYGYASVKFTENMGIWTCAADRTYTDEHSGQALIPTLSRFRSGTCANPTITDGMTG